MHQYRRCFSVYIFTTVCGSCVRYDNLNQRCFRTHFLFCVSIHKSDFLSLPHTSPLNLFLFTILFNICSVFFSLSRWLLSYYSNNVIFKSKCFIWCVIFDFLIFVTVLKTIYLRSYIDRITHMLFVECYMFIQNYIEETYC